MDAIGEQSLRWFSTEKVSDEPDLPALVREYSGLLYRVALSLLRHPAEAEDVVQDVFVRVLQRQHELTAIVDLRPWLVRIAWNLALDRLRKTRPQQFDETFAMTLVSADLPADQQLAESARIQQVFNAVERLPPREREALLLSAVDELNTAEIATILGKSESSIRSLLFRARTHLRERLGE